MNITYMPRRFETDPEFLKHWVAYASSSISQQDYKCSCGAVLHPVLQYANQDTIPTKTLFAQLSHRLACHLKTNRHNHSIQNAIKFTEYLRDRLEKDVFRKLWDDFVRVEFGEVV